VSRSSEVWRAIYTGRMFRRSWEHRVVVLPAKVVVSLSSIKSFFSITIQTTISHHSTTSASCVCPSMPERNITYNVVKYPIRDVAIGHRNAFATLDPSAHNACATDNSLHIAIELSSNVSKQHAW
jgi:hypothetical protein